MILEGLETQQSYELVLGVLNSAVKELEKALDEKPGLTEDSWRRNPKLCIAEALTQLSLVGAMVCEMKEDNLKKK